MDTEKKPNIPFSGKMCVPLNALFSRKYRFSFRSETEKRTSGASGTAKRRSHAQSGRAERSKGRQSRCRERAERAEGGGRRAKARRPSQGRASGASEHLPTKSSSQQLGRREVQPLCSVLAVNWGRQHPIGEDTEKRRNGTETAPLFCCHLFMNTGA